MIEINIFFFIIFYIIFYLIFFVCSILYRMIKNQIISFLNIIIIMILFSALRKVTKIRYILRNNYDFSVESPQNENRTIITDKEKNNCLQRIVISTFALKFFSRSILNFQEREKMLIREELLCQNKFQQFILDQINKQRQLQIAKGLTINLITHQWLKHKLQKDNFAKVLYPFKFNSQGKQISSQVWFRNCMDQAKKYKRLLFNPATINTINNESLCGTRNRQLYGQTGASKSISFFLYQYLTSFYHLNPFPIREQQKLFIQQFTSYKQIKESMRFIYVIFQQLDTLRKIYERLIPQFEGIYSKNQKLVKIQFISNQKESEDYYKLVLIDYLEKIFSKIGENEVNFVLVIDYTNVIFEQLRTIIKEMKQQKISILLDEKSPTKQPSKFTQSITYKNLKNYNEILKLLSKYFKNIFLDGSFQFEPNTLYQLPAKQRNDFQFLDELLKDNKFIVQKCKYLQYSKSQCYHLDLYKLLFSEIEISCRSQHIYKDELQFVKKVFNQTFILTPNRSLKDIKLWKETVRFFTICDYFYIKRFDARYQVKKCLQYQEGERKTQLSQYFIRLKQTLEDNYFYSINQENVFLYYIQKGNNHQVSLNRHFLLLDIFYSSQQAILVYDNKNISILQKQFLAANMPYLNYNIQNNTLFLKDSTTIYLHEVQARMVRRQYLQQLRYIGNSLWLQNINNSAFFDLTLKNISHLLFKYKHIVISARDAANNEYIQYQIKDKIQYTNLKRIQQNKDPQEYFKDFIYRCNKQPLKKLGGYQADKNIFEISSQLFDNIIIKKIIQEQSTFEIIALKFTMGAITQDLRKQIIVEKIQKFFEKVQFNARIRFTLYVIAPQYHVKSFLKQKQNTQTYFSYQPQKIRAFPYYGHSFTYKLAYFNYSPIFLHKKEHSSSYTWKNIDLLEQTWCQLKEICKRYCKLNERAHASQNST